MHTLSGAITGASHKATILIAEDDAISADALTYVLHKLGYQVAAAVSSGAEVIEFSRAFAPDMILMDINLRGDMDGIQAAEQIRSMRDIPIIYLTAYSDSATLQRANITRPYGYILKPYDQRTLSTTIEMGLIEHRLAMEVKENEERFQTCVENLLDCFAIYQAVRSETGQIADFEVVYVNPAACKNNHRTRDEQIGKRMSALYPGQFSSSLFPNYVQVVETGATLELDAFVYQETLPDGVARRAFDIRATKLNDGIAVSWRDVSERRFMEQTLRSNQDRTQALLNLYRKQDATQDEIIHTAIEQTLELSGSQLCLFGILNTEITQVTAYFGASTPGSDPSKSQSAPFLISVQDLAPWNLVITGQQVAVINAIPPDFAAQNHLPPHHQPIFRFAGIPVSRRGKVVFFCGLANKASDYQSDDIAQISLFVEGVWERIERLRIEGIYQNLFTTVSDAILVFDAEKFNIIDFNQSATALYGYAQNALSRMNFFDLSLGQDAIRSDFQQVFSTGIARIALQYHRRLDGTTFPVEITASSFFIQGRRVVCAVIRDITESRQRSLDLEFANQFSSALKTVFFKPDILRVILDFLTEKYNARWAVLSLVESISGRGVIESWRGFDNLSENQTPKLELSTATILRRPTTGQPFETDAYIPACLGMAPAVVCIPLVDQNQAISFIWLGRKTAFTDYEIHSLNAVAGIAANALQRAVTLETLEQRVADRTRELATLYNVATIITEEHDLNSILKRALSLTLETLNSQQGMIHLVGELEGQITPSPALVLAVDKGFSPLEREEIVNPPPEINYPQIVLSSSQSLFRSNPGADPQSIKTYLGVPMRIRGNEVIGVISVYRAQDTFFSTEEIALLSTVADEIAVMIENVRLRKQAEQGAVLEERQRLARELHDSATQALYSLTLFASAGKELAQKGDLIRLRSTIERINVIALQALKEMRLLIYELHPPTLKGDGLVTALQQRLDSVERRANVKTRLLISGEIALPASIASEMNRIAQEALNNILKHAAASSVTIHIRSEQDHIELEITDDGRGFDPLQAADQGGLGLLSLNERTKRLGGSILITTSPGSGTKVTVSIPQINSQQR